MLYQVRFYTSRDGAKPVVEFLEELRTTQPILHKLLVAGIKKLEQSERLGPPLTELVDREHSIYELRLGSANIARVFFFFRQGQEIILANGYVKKQQKVSARELARARAYRADWIARFP